VVMTFSSSGLVKLSNSIHTPIRDGMTTSSWKGQVSGYNHLTSELYHFLFLYASHTRTWNDTARRVQHNKKALILRAYDTSWHEAIF
ncbi:hypothetical protein, partial [Pseudodesulfovibrio alkaliphilus]|uniref:hypothetical protein n=1 Tax=Pseudodesulfovibrio alkaliphilus TaxID=2661613 RepID=UPI001E58B1EE